MEMKSAITAADQKAKYDEGAKRLLGQKQILAYILVKTVDEFKGMNPRDVVPYIEGEPFIGMVPVEPGMTNSVKEKQGQRIVGANSENSEINEGLIRFDIIFYVRMKDGISQIIINIEAQKGEPSGYDILNRAVFYVSRLISSQKERDFVKTNYNDIKRVFSIWICMNMAENCMDYIHLVNDKLIGSCQWKGRLDLLNIVMIGLSDKLPKHDEKYELHRLLGTLFSEQLTKEEKLNIVEAEYHIPAELIREDVTQMCNLSESIEEKGIAKGEAGIIMKMYKNGFTIEQIADITDKDITDIKTIIEGKTPVGA